jgi:hypothetical protein
VAVHSALPLFVPNRDNLRMDAPTTSLGRLDRFARHLVAMFATAIVLVTLGWKNQQYQLSGMEVSGLSTDEDGFYGWPQFCVGVEEHLTWDTSTQAATRNSPSRYSVTSWPSLLFDAFVAVASLIATWILFGHTQRRCQRWWQLSLASLFAVAMLAAVVCTVLKSDSLWGW